MIEVCEVMICFGRYDETEQIPKPMFGGSKGEDFDKWAERIEAMFHEALADIEVVSIYNNVYCSRKGFRVIPIIPQLIKTEYH